MTTRKYAHRFGVLLLNDIVDSMPLWAVTRSKAEGFIMGIQQYYPCPDMKLIEFTSFNPREYKVVEEIKGNGRVHVNSTPTEKAE